MRLVEVEGDLLDQDVEVLVNAWNRNLFPWWLLLPQGVSGALKRRAGLAPFRELARMPMIPLGEAVITGAGELPHRALIHVAGIDLLWRSSEQTIHHCVRSALALANAHGLASIAFPVIGAGSGGMDEVRAHAALIDALQHTTTRAIEVRVVRFRGR
ncbi:MAG: Appr-1-p processing protein [Deltaproteobacteria bacterium]|nr:MAG: Appr-1-p processing protein [Deltaproteobacteria bacterium]